MREALKKARRSELALIVSVPTYEQVVRSGLLRMGETHFTPVVLDLPKKQFTHTAYIHVPGYETSSFASGVASTAPDSDEAHVHGP